MAKQESSIYLSRTLVSGHDKGITILPCNYFDIRVFISFFGYTQHTRCILENYYTRKWRSGYGKRNKRLFERTFRNSEFRRERWIEDEEGVRLFWIFLLFWKFVPISGSPMSFEEKSGKLMLAFEKRARSIKRSTFKTSGFLRDELDSLRLHYNRKKIPGIGFTEISDSSDLKCISRVNLIKSD